MVSKRRSESNWLFRPWPIAEHGVYALHLYINPFLHSYQYPSLSTSIQIPSLHRSLIAESAEIFTLVNPDILKAIDPALGQRERGGQTQRGGHGVDGDALNEDRKVNEEISSGTGLALPRQNESAAVDMKRTVTAAAPPPPEPESESEDDSDDSDDSDLPPPPPSYYGKMAMGN